MLDHLEIVAQIDGACWENLSCLRSYSLPSHIGSVQCTTGGANRPPYFNFFSPAEVVYSSIHNGYNKTFTFPPLWPTGRADISVWGIYNNGGSCVPTLREKCVSGFQFCVKSLAAKYLWWMKSDEALKRLERIVIQVMNIGVFSDVVTVLDSVGEE